jgi:ribosome maturation factor RimP
MEVSSPGADRPVETRRDFEKHRGDKVEVRLFQKLDGSKQFTGALENMDEETVAITAADGETKTFPRKAVALVKPVVEPAENEE